ncbi:D-aminoacyl-tRNA deacylase [Salinigranum sp.]|uniref:D-aminoacyl-tRNA deacylase n=1 Tax=Salinigranum sp. TaxID=1966351 RepID=UPI003565FAAA
MIALVVSRADRASEHVGEHVLDVAEWNERVDDARPSASGGGTYYTRPGFELRTFADLHLDLDGVAGVFDDPDLLCFLSRHSGETGPLLSAHFTGNFGSADYGGSDGELARACPNAQKAVVEALTEHAPEGYDVGVECTHHGPSEVGVPSMFVELGSSEAEWDDPAGARAVARAVLDVEGVGADRRDGEETRHVVGFGGGHYAPRFERVIRETDWAVGHVGADWPLEAMGPVGDNQDVLPAAFAESAADLALVDGDHPRVSAAVEELGYRVVSETFLRETRRVPRALVDHVESELGPVDDGVRFGAHARVGLTAAPGVAFEVTALSRELVDAALGVDHDAARTAVDDHTVAFHTEEGGRRPTGRVALPTALDDADDTGAFDRLVDALCAVLRTRYDEVTREDDVVVAHERAFDAAAAADLGVPEGPAFGRLAGGESVEIAGEEVAPEDVHRDRTVTFSL